jgi:cytidine deaminase
MERLSRLTVKNALSHVICFRMKERRFLMDFNELVEIAKQKLNPRDLTDHCFVASVACALETEDGKVYTGVNIDSSSSLGFCAEHGAIADMIQHGESRIRMCVAVHHSGTIYPPCGRCRQFIYNINYENVATEFLLPNHEIATLNNLLPHLG